MVAAVAVMVTVEVTGVDPPPPLPPPAPPSPQPEASPSPMKATASNSLCCSLGRLQQKRKTVKPSVIALREERELGRDAAADCEPVEIVSTEVAAGPEGIMLGGLNEQATPTGSPEQAKLTVELKPYSGVTVSMTVPRLPDVTVNEVGNACKVKRGGPMVYAAEATALFA